MQSLLLLNCLYDCLVLDLLVDPLDFLIVEQLTLLVVVPNGTAVFPHSIADLLELTLGVDMAHCNRETRLVKLILTILTPVRLHRKLGLLLVTTRQSTLGPVHIARPV